MDKTLVVMAAGLGSRYGGVKQIERLGPDGEILMELSLIHISEPARYSWSTPFMMRLRQASISLF